MLVFLEEYARSIIGATLKRRAGSEAVGRASGAVIVGI
jgi:hypothetical protein